MTPDPKVLHVCLFYAVYGVMYFSEDKHMSARIMD